MATWAEIQKKAAREATARRAGIAPQFPDIFEVAQMVPKGVELLPGMTELASGIEESALARRANIAEAAQPGITQQFATAGNQISQMLQGAVPQDVIDRLQSNVAARSLGAGVPGSGFAGSQFARTLGLTSLDMIGQGIGQLMGITPVQQGVFGVEPVDISADIPGTTDYFNQLLGQELSRSQVELALYGLDVSREGAGTGGATGGGTSGGGGGGYFETGSRLGSGFGFGGSGRGTPSLLGFK